MSRNRIVSALSPRVIGALIATNRTGAPRVTTGGNMNTDRVRAARAAKRKRRAARASQRRRKNRK